jgi:hypothetical protein
MITIRAETRAPFMLEEKDEDSAHFKKTLMKPSGITPNL